jgi:Polyketide cyclase / dehydrase and lipid transport
MNNQIIFPIKFDPENSPVFVSNEIEINASPEKVWGWLISAKTWPDWYFNASNIEIANQHTDKLLAGTKFTWKTFGANLETEVVEYIPNERIAWLAKGIGILAYHAWLIIPTISGCKVITQETQHGWICRLGKLLMPDRMYNYHQKWLEGLKQKSELI